MKTTYLFREVVAEGEGVGLVEGELKAAEGRAVHEGGIAHGGSEDELLADIDGESGRCILLVSIVPPSHFRLHRIQSEISSETVYLLLWLGIEMEEVREQNNGVFLMSGSTVWYIQVLIQTALTLFSLQVLMYVYTHSFLWQLENIAFKPLIKYYWKIVSSESAADNRRTSHETCVVRIGSLGSAGSF